MTTTRMIMMLGSTPDPFRTGVAVEGNAGVAAGTAVGTATSSPAGDPACTAGSTVAVNGASEMGPVATSVATSSNVVAGHKDVVDSLVLSTEDGMLALALERS